MCQTVGPNDKMKLDRGLSQLEISGYRELILKPDFEPLHLGRMFFFEIICLFRHMSKGVFPTLVRCCFQLPHL